MSIIGLRAHQPIKTWSNMDKPTSSPEPLGTVRRKANFLPTVLVSPELDSAILSRLSGCFATIIRQAHRQGDAAWKTQVDTFEKHGLFELKVPQELILNPINFEFTRKDGEKRVVNYTSSTPISYGFETLRLDLDRARVSDEKYLAETAAICAYLFTWRLVKQPVEPESIVLHRLDAASLSEYLHKHHRGEVSLSSIAKFLIGRAIAPLLDEIPALRRFEGIGERLAVSLEARFASVMPVIEAQVNVRLAEALDEINQITKEKK
jgi:hypothetical protein